MTPDLLRAVGEALYGEYWIKPLAGALQVNERTVQRWAAGEYLPRIEAQAGILGDTRALLVARGHDLARVVEMVDQARG